MTETTNKDHQTSDNLHEDDLSPIVTQSVADHHEESAISDNTNEVETPPVKNQVQSEETQVSSGLISVRDAGSGRVITITGRIITAENEVFQQSEDITSLCLLTDTGEFIVSKSDKSNPKVISFKQLVKRCNYKIKKEEFVDLGTINQFYVSYSRHGAELFRTLGDTSRMQRQFVDLIATAVEQNATDVHIDKKNTSAIVRFRINGLMREHRQLGASQAEEMMSAAFALADASDASYQPYEHQGARISRSTAELPNDVQSLRLQWDASAFGGRALYVRILKDDSSGEQKTVRDLGYSRSHISQFAILRAKPHGIVVVAGPTGSGKSTTLKYTLEELIEERQRELNVITVEDPPEYVIHNATQIAVANANTPEERKTKFLQAINAFLRSDPDVGMIGEIRDSESAGLAFYGAESGHQIYTTLHANDAMGIITRLKGLNIPDYHLYDPTLVSGLVGQRLIRRLCQHCKQPVLFNNPENIQDKRIANFLEASGTENILYGRNHTGCEHCDSGYEGMEACAEIIMPDSRFMKHMENNDKIAARNHWISELEGAPMVLHAFNKAKEGLVSPYDIEHSIDLLIWEDYMKAALNR